MSEYLCFQPGPTARWPRTGCARCFPLRRESLILVVSERFYAREGVGYLWLVDPNVQSLEAFELHGTEWVLIDTLSDDAPVSLPPFEAISFQSW